MKQYINILYSMLTGLIVNVIYVFVMGWPFQVRFDVHGGQHGCSVKHTLTSIDQPERNHLGEVDWQLC